MCEKCGHSMSLHDEFGGYCRAGWSYLYDFEGCRCDRKPTDSETGARP